MPYMLELAERGAHEEKPFGVRLRATLMREAIDDFARTTADGFHQSRSDATGELLDAYAENHLRGGSSDG